MLGLLHEMREVMLAPDNISYNSSLTAFERASQKVKAAQLMATMQAERVQADLVTLNAKISSYAQGSDWERALLTKSAMRERADVVTYGATLLATWSPLSWESLKNRNQNGTFANGNEDNHLRHPSASILRHTHMCEPFLCFDVVSMLGNLHPARLASVPVRRVPSGCQLCICWRRCAG